MKRSPKLLAVLRRLLLGLAIIATLVALVVVVENWRGDRAWIAVETELKAKGERLDFAAFQSPSIPDGQNFFKAPLLARILYDRPADAERKKLLAESRLMDFRDLGKYGGALKGFPALRDRLKAVGLLSTPYTVAPAADVLSAMKPISPFLDELREAAQDRPKAALDRGSSPFENPRVGAEVAYQLAQALGVRALAEIELGRTDEAFADIVALQRIANGLADHPATILDLLVGVAMQGIAAGAVSEGCRSHLWSGPRLVQFQKLADELQPLTGFRNAACAERAQIIYLVDARPAIPAGDFTWPRWLFRGWAQQNKVTYCHRLDSEVLSAITTHPDRIISVRRPAETKTKGTLAKLLSPYGLVAGLLPSNYGRILEGLGTSAEKLKLASVSWAIERYRLAHGHYPDSLGDLVPSLLPTAPNGIVNGQPLRYSKLPQGGHQVYSVGWDGRDDDGKNDDIVVRLPEGV